MISSIRTYLLVNLLVSLTLVASMAIIGNIFMEHENFQTHLDSQLSLSAFTIDAFLDDDASMEELAVYQQQITKIPKKLNTFHYQKDQQEPLMNALLKSVQFQIWGANNQLFLSSFAPPKIKTHPKTSGFSTVWKDGIPWRQVTLHNQSTDFFVVVYQRENIRQELEQRMTKNSVTMMLLAYPFLGLMIWIIVGKGLTSLSRIARALRRRKHNQLNALRIDDSIPSEVRPLIDEINQLFTRLREAFMREKRFASDAAHELRTPLAAVNAHAQIALHEEDSEQRNKAIKKLLTSVKRSTHVISQLLTLSRMVPEAGLSDIKPTKLYSVAQAVLVDLSPQAIEKNINLELTGSEQATLQGNDIALGILIRNLADNAIRYTPEGGNVTIDIQETPSEVRLCVMDNGPGIPPNMRKRIFERFFRMVGNKSSGSGLGLSIVSQIASLHKASISLSAPKKGTGLHFEVSFPKG